MRWALLLLFALLSLCHVGAETPKNASAAETSDEATSAESSEKSKEEKTSDLLEEDDVLVLHEDNFDNALKTYKYLLVKFYAPWCTHCQELAPMYSDAARALKAESSEARLAKVDATEEKDLSSEFHIKGYPDIRFFKDGDRNTRIEFGGKRNTDGIIKWMLRRIGPPAAVLASVAEAEKFIESNENAVVAFFQDSEDSDIKIFNEVAANSEHLNFAVTHAEEVFQKYGVSADSVILFNKSGTKFDYVLDEDLGLDEAELHQFLMVNSMDLVTEYSEQTSDKIFAAKIPNHLLLFINKTEDSHLQLLENFREAAPEYKGKVLFIFIDAAGPYSGVLEYFGLQTSDIPTIRFINIDLVKKYAFNAEKITTESVRAFCQGVLDGTIKQNLLSEELPEDWDKNPVKVLVGTNFEDVAYDETKNVFVKFYAPWCSHCKELEPIWAELGEKYKDHPDVIIAKIDATANEIDGMRVRGFPNLRFFPAGKDRKMIEYNKNRTVELFSKFIDSGGVLPGDEGKSEEELEAERRGDIKVEDVLPEKTKDEL